MNRKSQTLEDLDRIAENDESAMSTGGWWARRSELLAEDVEVVDVDVKMLLEARAELVERQEIIATGHYGYQIWASVRRHQDTILAVTLRRPELTLPGDEQLMAIRKGG